MGLTKHRGGYRINQNMIISRTALFIYVLIQHLSLSYFGAARNVNYYSTYVCQL